MLRPSSRRTDIVIIALAAGSTGAGCAGLKPPGIEAGEATVAEVSREGLRFDVPLELHNPNHEPLELHEFTYEASVNGRRVYSGRWSAEATLGPGATQPRTLPVVVRYEQLPVAVDQPVSAAWIVRGSLLYVTPDELAEILLDTRIRRPRAHFKGRGTITLVPPPITEIGADPMEAPAVSDD